MQEIKAFRCNEHYDNEDIFIRVIDRESGTVGKIVMEPHTRGTPAEPAMAINTDIAQSLMDSLWDAGIRPAGAKGSAGQLTAVQGHLSDMREIAFKFINSTVK